MKFLVSKKLIDNRVLYTSVLWMVILLIIALALSLTSKSIDFGSTPQMWVNTIMGNELEFIDPMGLSDLLLSLHTDFFGLTLVFILITALVVRTSRPQMVKVTVLFLGIAALLVYGTALIASVWIGRAGVVVSWGGFVFFHLFMIGCALDILILLLRKKF